LIASEEDKRRHQSSCGETVLGDFYDQSIRLSLVEYLRPELPFEGLEKLVAAIKKGQWLALSLVLFRLAYFTS
jgi:FAD synthase